MPTVKDVSTWVDAASTTQHGPITLPVSVAEGDLLVCVFSCDGSPMGSAQANNWHLLSRISYSTTVTGFVFWKIAETENELAINTSVSEIASAVVYGIEDAWFVTANTATGSSANSTHGEIEIGEEVSDPPKDVLYLAARCGDAMVAASAAPAGFSDMQTAQATSSLGATTNTAVYVGTEEVLTPGAWTVTTEQWVTFALAIYASVRVSGVVYGANGSPIKCEFQVIDRATGTPYAQYISEVPAKTFTASNGAFVFGMFNDGDEVNILFLDPTDTLEDLLISRVEPV